MKSPPLKKVPYLFVCVVLLGTTLVAQTTNHVVARGETLYSIARQHRVDVQALQKANGITDASKLRLGQELKIPGTTSSGSIDRQTETKKPPLFDVYIVKKGDTFYSIARIAEIALSQLLSDNKLSSASVLRVGQTLSIRKSAAISQVVSAPVTTVRISDAQSVSTTTIEKSPGQPGTQGNDLTGQVTSGTSFHTTVYTQGSKLTWPHPGERFSMSGKLPGILIKAHKADIVKAVAAGKVVYSGPHATFGHIIFVQSTEGFIYIYGGNENSSFKTGDVVQVGDTIGTVGITPGILEPQVYFSVWKDGSYIDASTVLK